MSRPAWLPTLTFIPIQADPSIPADWLAPVYAHGLPQAIMKIFDALPILRLVDFPPYGPLIHLGHQSENILICLHPATEQVVYVQCLGTPPKVVGTGLINSSYRQCIEYAKVVYDRLPYDSWTPDNPLDQFEVEAHERLQAEWYQAFIDMETSCIAINPMMRMKWENVWRDLFQRVLIGDVSTYDLYHDDE
jgi:hypothetical protein